MEQTLAITHAPWAMFGILPAGKFQPPHRHEWVTLDLILDFQPGCYYSVLGESLDAEGALVDPVRIDWEPRRSLRRPAGEVALPSQRIRRRRPPHPHPGRRPPDVPAGLDIQFRFSTQPPSQTE